MATLPPLLSELLPLPQQWQLLLLLPIASLLLVIGRDTGRCRRHLRLPPGPARLPFLGNLLQLGALPHRSLRDLARRHGPVMMLRLGSVPAVVVSSPEAAQEVLRTHDADCCSRPASPGPMRLSYGYKDVAFAPYDGYGRAARRLFVAELFSAPRVQAAWHARQDQVEKLIGKLTRPEPKPVELNDHIFALTDGIIGTVAFGSIYGTELFAGRKRFHHLLDDVMDMLASFSAEDFFPNAAAGRLFDHLTGLVARRERVFQQLDAFFEMVIEQNLDSSRTTKSTNDSDGGGNLVDALIGLWKQGKQYGDLRFTRENVKAIIFDAFIGGIGTSSVTILWAMAELIRAPRVMRKVQRRDQGRGGRQRRRHGAAGRPAEARLPQDGRQGDAAAAPAGNAADAAGDDAARQDRRVRRAGEDAGAGERVGDREGRGEVGRAGGVRPGQVRDEAGGFQRRALRLAAVRVGAADLPRHRHGRRQRGVHAGQPAALLRLGAAGGDGGGGAEHGGVRRPRAPQEGAARARAH